MRKKAAKASKKENDIVWQHYKENLETGTRMWRASSKDFYFLLCIITLQVICGAERNILRVGEELKREILPLHTGFRIYQIQGLKPSTMYEVKISYPASIPASFSLQLKNGNPDSVLKHQRKLLNTEKLIFKNDYGNENGTYVVLTVEPEGVVAIPHGKEREVVVYNIVCDELAVGIPHDAWRVVILVILCLGVAFVIPSFLPSSLINTHTRQTPKNS